MVTITLVDQGQERYTVTTSSTILGRMYDNISEGITIVKPAAEADRTCTMIISNGACGVMGKIIDEVTMTSNTITIPDSWSCYNKISIGFSFSDSTGYVKNSEVVDFKFLFALPPEGWTPTEPIAQKNLNRLFDEAFVDVAYASGSTTQLQFKNIYSNVVKTLDLSIAGAIQSDLAETDTTKLDYVKNKSTIYLTNAGDPNPTITGDTSKYATENYVNQYGGKIDTIKVQGVTQTITDKTVDLNVATTTQINKTVQTDTGVSANVDNVTLNKSYVNINSGSTSQESTTIPLANATTGGIMSHSDYNQIRDNTSRIENLEAKTTRLLYTSTTESADMNITSSTTLLTGSRLAIGSILNGVTLSEITEISQDTTMAVGDKIATNSVLVNGSTVNGARVPTQADILAFVTELGYTSPFAGIAVVEAMTYHIWHYYQNGGIGWRDDGADTVNQFTNTTPGVVKGSLLAGQVYAENDGTGSVNGWDALNTTVNNKQDKLIAGTNITIAADGKTISAAGSTTLNGLSDVDSSSLVNGDVLKYDSAQNKWKPDSVIVDQTYNASSTNAQSGVAVAQAVASAGVAIRNLGGN